MTYDYKHYRLPGTLSGLLKIAIKDVQKLEKDPRYELDMGVFHSVGNSGKCYVCMAGAVMARRFKLDPSETAHPGNFSDRAYDKLLAIDWMRKGSFQQAARQLGVDVRDKLGALEEAERAVGYFRSRPAGPDLVGRVQWENYERAVEVLERAGL